MKILIGIMDALALPMFITTATGTKLTNYLLMLVVINLMALSTTIPNDAIKIVEEGLVGYGF